MSYAEAAASSGPIGAERLPKPTQVKTTTNPSGGVETVDHQEFEELKKEFEEGSNEALNKAKSKARDLKKELHDLEDEAKPYWDKAVAQVKSSIAKLSDYFGKSAATAQQYSSQALATTCQELQNPVVVAQTLVGITGVVAGYIGYLERKRINTDNKAVLCVHASVLTGLVLADGFLFNKYYPKYKKN